MLTESDRISDATDHVTVILAKPAGHPSSTNNRDTPDAVTVQSAVANTDSNVQARQITLPEACRTGVIPLKPDAARATRMRDPKSPKSQGERRDQTYTPEKLQNWHQNRTAANQ
jgi:hypothetical protein